MPAQLDRVAPGATLLLRAAFERIRVSLWFVPAVSIVAAYVIATWSAGVAVEGEAGIRRLLFGGGAESARQLMSTVAGSMITVTGVVFTLTVVALQISSGQYSPRVLRNFLRDPANQTVLAGFLATFAWSVAVLPTIRIAQGDDQEYVPRLAVTIGTVLVMMSLGMLVLFIHRLTTSIRVESVMRTAGRETMETIRRVHPTPRHDAPVQPDRPDIPDDATSVPFSRSGYIQAVDHRRLLRIATDHDLVVMLHPIVGAHVVEGTLMARVWAPGGGHEPPADVGAQLDRAVQIGFERTMQEDVAFGIRQLTDIAVKALSPGINDPTTAADAISNLSIIMAQLAARSLDHRLYVDDDGVVRVGVPRPTFDEYLTMCVSQIRRYGASEPAVVNALMRLLVDVVTTSSDEGVDAAVQREADVLIEAATAEVTLAADLEDVLAARADLDAALEMTRRDRPLAR